MSELRLHMRVESIQSRKKELSSPVTVRKDERTAEVRLENSNCQVFTEFCNVTLIFRCWHTSEQFLRVDIPVRDLIHTYIVRVIH